MSINIFPEEKLSFDEVLNLRMVALKRQMRIYEPRDPSLKSVTNISGGVIFDRAESESSNVMRVLELHVWKDGFHIKMTVEAIDAGYITAENTVPGDTRKTTTTERIQTLLDVLKRTSLRRNGEIPNLSGVCILNGFVTGKATGDENIQRIFTSSRYEGVIFRFETSSDHIRDDKLADRTRKADEIIFRSEGAIIRRGQHDILGVSEGEEFLYTIKDNENAKKSKKLSFNFSFEGNNRIGSAKTPLISLDFLGNLSDGPSLQTTSLPSSGKINSGAETTLAKDKVLEIWEGVVRSIHPRSGAF